MGWVRSSVASLLACAAAACAVFAVAAPTAVLSAPPGAARPAHQESAASTSLWSARRVPGLIVGAAEAPRLTASLLPSVAGFGDTCFAVAEGDREVAGYRADVPLVPASTQKLFTAAGALAVFGADHTFETTVVADGDVASGRAGRLWLVGGGDPLITTDEYAEAWSTRLESLADAVAAAGVREVAGGVTGDDSRYQDVWYLPNWPPSYGERFEVGPVAALTVNDGIILVRGKPVVVDDPAVYAAGELTRLLRARGIRVLGEPSRGAAPPGAPMVAGVHSRPLRDVVGDMLLRSHNLTAEMLVREIGLARAGYGSTSAGTRAVLDELGRLGVHVDGVQMADGSGLGRENHATCRALVDVLGLAARPGFESLSSGLPVAGRSGSLRRGLEGSPLDGVLRAKTGTISHVAGLAGFLDTDRPLRFAVLLNGNLSDSPDADRLRFVDRLAGTPLLDLEALPHPADPRPPGPARQRA